MIWTNRNIIFFSLFIFFQLLFFESYNWNFKNDLISTKKIIYILFYQTLFILSFISLFKKKYLIISVSIVLLLFLNLIWSPSSNLKTLPPYMYKKVKVVGNVMPGFKDINLITTDKLGFRVNNSINYDLKIKTRIFTIGGSTTEEIYVDDKETWSYLLEKKLNKNRQDSKKFEVINTGVSGLKSIHHLATQTYVTKFNPDYLIFLMGVNDWNSHIESLVVRKKQIININQNFFPFMSNTILYKSSKNLSTIMLSNKNFNLSKNKVKFEDGKYYSNQNDSLNRGEIKKIKINNVSEHFKFYVNEIANLCKQSSYKCVFVNQPTAYSTQVDSELKKRFWMTPPSQNYTLSLDSMIKISRLYNQWLIDFSKLREIHSCDLHNKVPPNISFFYDDVHFNENGSKLVSELIYSCIKRIIHKKN